jgi:hypothetical protein
MKKGLVQQVKSLCGSMWLVLFILTDIFLSTQFLLLVGYNSDGVAHYLIQLQHAFYVYFLMQCLFSGLTRIPKFIYSLHLYIPHKRPHNYNYLPVPLCFFVSFFSVIGFLPTNAIILLGVLWGGGGGGQMLKNNCLTSTIAVRKTFSQAQKTFRPFKKKIFHS